jgi:hypothetical protein
MRFQNPAVFYQTKHLRDLQKCSHAILPIFMEEMFFSHLKCGLCVKMDLFYSYVKRMSKNINLLVLIYNKININRYDPHKAKNVLKLQYCLGI